MSDVSSSGGTRSLLCEGTRFVLRASTLSTHFEKRSSPVLPEGRFFFIVTKVDGKEESFYSSHALTFGKPSPTLETCVQNLEWTLSLSERLDA